jgi:hypothetical protein
LKIVLGIALVLIALAVMIVPAFSDCQSQGKSITLANGKTIPMKCHWSARAELAVGAPLLVVGALFPFTRRKSGLYILSILGVVLGAVVILIPNYLIGVCSTAMPCNTVMQPTLSILGGLAVVGSLGGLVLARRANN